MKKTWNKPGLVVYGDVETLTQQGQVRGTNKCRRLGVGTPVTTSTGTVKYCGFVDAVNQINSDIGS